MEGKNSAQVYKIEAQNVRCWLSSLGASIVSVRTPDASGVFSDIALSPMRFADVCDPSLAGRTIGPCCGRVRGGEMEIHGHSFQLSKNEGENHLHGGFDGVAHQYWRGEAVSKSRVRLSLSLPNGLDGYPGNRVVQAEYSAYPGALEVVYTAQSDRPTWLCLTNHVYWDLSGRFDGSAMEQTLEIAAKRAVLNDAAHLPEKIVPVAESAFDFLHPDSPAMKLAQYPDDPQFAIAHGFNNAFLLETDTQGPSARLFSPHTGRQMALYTDQPALVLYTGGFLGPKTALLKGRALPGCALALEAQAVPDPFHLPGAAPEILKAGQVWRRYIRWEFDIAGVP